MMHASGDEQRHVKPFGDHLEDLRRALVKSLLAMVVATVVCFYFVDGIILLLKLPLESMLSGLPEEDELRKQMLRALTPTEVFIVALKVAFVSGLVVASPFVLYELWAFVSPGLTAKERRMVLPAFGAGAIFFLLGAAFCYFVVLKICLSFFWHYTVTKGIRPDWTISHYVSFVSSLLVAFGIAFEMPVVCAALARLGLITSQMLSSKRRYAIVGIFLVAAILTPPDVVSQVLLAVPMLGLYELSILIARLMAVRAERTM